MKISKPENVGDADEEKNNGLAKDSKTNPVPSDSKIRLGDVVDESNVDGENNCKNCEMIETTNQVSVEEKKLIGMDSLDVTVFSVSPSHVDWLSALENTITRLITIFNKNV